MILPLGQIIQKLGYRLDWSSDSCRLISPSGKVHRLRVSKGCPHMSVNEALGLIARLEERALKASVKSLEAACVRTQQVVAEARLRTTKTWFQWLEDYAVSGRATDAALALQEAPFLARDEMVGVLPSQESTTGWRMLQGLHAYSRRCRRRLHSSKNIVLHLFSGTKSTPQVTVPDDCTLLSLDIQRCVTENVRGGPAWNAVVWAARAGKISHIIGAPPRSSVMQALGTTTTPSEERYDAETDLVTRMVVSHALASAGRKAHPDPRHRTVEVGFLMQYPEFRAPSSPLLEHAHGGFWASELWSIYKEEAGLAKVQVRTPSCNPEVFHTWTVGTNLGVVLDQARRQSESPVSRLFHMPRWTEGFRDLLAQAMMSHHRYVRIAAMSPQAWREHLRAGHQPFYKGCRACIMGKSSGRQHRRARHPSVDCLHVDVAGPIRVPGG